MIPTLDPPIQRRHPRPAGLGRDVVGRAGAVTASAALPYLPRSTTSTPTSTELAAAARNGDAVGTAILAQRTKAAATASAVRRLSWPGNAVMTGTSRRMLKWPISAGSWSRELCTRRCSSSELAARARDSAPRPGRATTRASRQKHEPVVNTSPASAAVISEFCRTLLLGQYGQQKGVVDNDHSRESGRSTLSQVGVSCDGIPCGLLVGAGGQVFTHGGSDGLGYVGGHFADVGRPKFARLRGCSAGSLCCCLQIPGGYCHH